MAPAGFALLLLLSALWGGSFLFTRVAVSAVETAGLIWRADLIELSPYLVAGLVRWRSLESTLTSLRSET